MTNSITRVGAGTPRGGQFAITTHQEPHLELSPTVLGNPVITGAVRPVDADETVEDPAGARTYRQDGTRVQATALDTSGALTTTSGVCAGVQSNADVDLQVVRHDDGTLGAYHPLDVTRDNFGPLWSTTGNDAAAVRTTHRNGHDLTVSPVAEGPQAQWSITTAGGQRIIGYDDTATEACATVTQFSDEYAAAQARAVVSPDDPDPDACLRDMLGGKDPNSFTPPF